MFWLWRRCLRNGRKFYLGCTRAARQGREPVKTWQFLSPSPIRRSGAEPWTQTRPHRTQRWRWVSHNNSTRGEENENQAPIPALAPTFWSGSVGATVCWGLKTRAIPSCGRLNARAGRSRPGTARVQPDGTFQSFFPEYSGIQGNGWRYRITSGDGNSSRHCRVGYARSSRCLLYRHPPAFSWCISSGKTPLHGKKKQGNNIGQIKRQSNNKGRCTTIHDGQHTECTVEGELVSDSSPAPVLDHLRKSKKLSLARIVVHRLVADLAKVFDPE